MHDGETDETLLPLGTVALRLSLPYWRLDRAARAGRIPCVVAGHIRLARVGDLDRIRDLMRSPDLMRGYRAKTCAAATA